MNLFLLSYDILFGTLRTHKRLSILKLISGHHVVPYTHTHTHTHTHTYTYIYMGTAVAQWLRCSATNRKVAGSIPAGVSGFFIDIKSFRSHHGLGVDSASNRNEYQEHFLGVRRPVRKADNLTTILCRCHEIWEP